MLRYNGSTVGLRGLGWLGADCPPGQFPNPLIPGTCIDLNLQPPPATPTTSACPPGQYPNPLIPGTCIALNLNPIQPAPDPAPTPAPGGGCPPGQIANPFIPGTCIDPNNIVPPGLVPPPVQPAPAQPSTPAACPPGQYPNPLIPGTCIGLPSLPSAPPVQPPPQLPAIILPPVQSACPAGQMLVLGKCIADPFNPVPVQDLYPTMSSTQQQWVVAALAQSKANAIKSNTPGWTNINSTYTHGPNSQTGGFQSWYNVNVASRSPVKKLRTDGFLDADTMDALRSFVGALGAPPYPTGSVMTSTTPTTQVPTPVASTTTQVPTAQDALAAAMAALQSAVPSLPVMPVTPPPPVQPAVTPGAVVAPTPSPGMSTGEIVGIATAGVVVVGGILYLATNGTKRR